MDMKLDINNLTVGYVDKDIIKNLNCTLSQGDVLALIGSNGSGKSTLLNTIAGLKQPVSGIIATNSLSITHQRHEYNSCLGYAPERAPLFYEQNITQYLSYVAKIRKFPNPKTRIKNILLKLNLWEQRNERISQLSKGTKQRINLAQSILHYPKILLLDEPSQGLDAQECERLYAHIKKHSQHMLVILATHDQHEVTLLCNKVLLLDSTEPKVMNINDALNNINETFSEVAVTRMGVKDDTKYNQA
jgi:ABC-2 type transport system ATP-binding protein